LHISLGDAALRGFEQSESDDAELAHSMQVRAHISQFVGKRSLDDEVVENILLKQQEENADEENLENVLMYLLKSYDNSAESQKEDFSTQSDEDSNSDLSTFERDAKWAPRFVGKRRSPMFVGRRRAPLFVGKRYAPRFVGKRYAPRFVGKRGAPLFVGKRGSPMFIGRRDSPLFIGRRENALPADTSFFVGGKRSVIAASDLKHTHNNDKLGFHHSDNQIKNKRERERFILPQEMQLLNGNPVYSDFSKRFVVPEFIGKREGLGSNTQYILSEKRFDTPFFVGRRSVDFSLEPLEESNPGFRYAVQQPAMHSENDRHLLKSVNSRT
jgi:hypothetical protein